ncbi:Ankyrin repeat protein [Mycena sanguinolenta]|uniref:Ankyrin repeat protein n=1 Tax=Mycena sanguinolenta TaxID=230812 RepID=A0A8H7DK28_9AGAR|nr:Ankyrin repeat protein [Mycena sanguinolenta]
MYPRALVLIYKITNVHSLYPISTTLAAAASGATRFMDPLTVVGALAAGSQLAQQLFQATLALASIYSHLKSASRTIAYQLAYLTELNAIAQTIKGASGQQSEAVDLALGRCLQLVEEIRNELRRRQPLETDSPGNRWRKSIIAALKEKRVADMFRQLAREKASLSLALSGFNATQSWEAAQAIARIDAKLVGVQLVLKTTSEKIATLSGPDSNPNGAISTQQNRNNTLTRVHSAPIPQLMSLEMSREVQADQALWSPIRDDGSPDTPSTLSLGSPVLRVPSTPETSSSQPSSGLALASSEVFLPGTAFSASSCTDPACTCSCHLQSRIAYTLLGAVVSVSITGYSSDRHVCHDPDLRTQSAVGWAYFIALALPIIGKIVTAIFRQTLRDGLHYRLRFDNLVRKDAIIFHYATTDDVEGLKAVLEERKGSPRDIRFDSKWTPLHFAIKARSFQAVKFLVNNGAEADLDTGAPMTTRMQAMELILSNSLSKRESENLANMIGHQDSDEISSKILSEMHFSRLHCEVLGLPAPEDLGDLDIPFDPANLDQDDQDTPHVDALDRTSRTALSWAAQRGDGEWCAKLLERGANMFLVDTEGNSALHYSVQARSPHALRALLSHFHGVDAYRPSNLNIINNGGWTPLHHAAYYQDDPAFVTLLISSGANINAVTKVGKTPAMMAALCKRASPLRVLIDHHANLNVTDKNGWNVLKLAILNSPADAVCVGLLVGASGMDLSPDQDDDGETVLHLAARKPALDIFDALKEVVRKKLVDPSERNREGLTAMEVLERGERVLAAKRIGDERLLAGFRQLIGVSP